MKNIWKNIWREQGCRSILAEVKFDQQDQHHLQAAEGWLGLGDWREANEELEQIQAGLRAHPDVLVVRWGVYAAAERWDVAADIARALVAKDPSAKAWLCLARSECRTGDLQVARDCLERAFALDRGLRQAALDEPDLEPLWANIGKL